MTRMGTAPTMTYAYGAGTAGPQAVTSVTGGTTYAYTYGARGNLLTRTVSGVTSNYTFDVEGRLTSVTGATTASFTYDADGQRVKAVYSNRTVYTPFSDYEITDNGSDGSIDAGSTTYRLAGRIVAVRTSGSVSHVAFDHLGSVGALFDATGTIVPNSLTRFDPFGNFRGTAPTTNPSTTDHGFTGHRHNNTGSPDLGLIYMNARYYLPEVGRFVSPDSLVPDAGNPQSYNRYSYALNSPVNYTDPTGHKECDLEQTCNPNTGSPAGSQKDPTSQLILSEVLPVVTEPRITVNFPLPTASSDLTGWLVNVLIAYTNSPQVNAMQAEWFLANWMMYVNRGGSMLLRLDVLQEWARQVGTGGIWDFKPDLERWQIFVNRYFVTLGGRNDIHYQAIANIFYGFIGRRIGMSHLLLQTGAGAAQLRRLDKWSENLAEYPLGLGDQEFDAWAVSLGVSLYDAFGHNLNEFTVDNFSTELGTYISQHPIPILR